MVPSRKRVKSTPDKDLVSVKIDNNFQSKQLDLSQKGSVLFISKPDRNKNKISLRVQDQVMPKEMISYKLYHKKINPSDIWKEISLDHEKYVKRTL